MAIPVRKEQLHNISCRDFFRQHVGPLKQKGRRFWGKCPFHQEKTDSFVVDERRFHCFGCGADGDLFELAKRIWGCGFFEVVQRLAAEHGIAADGSTITTRIRSTVKSDEEQFHAVFIQLFQIREAFYSFLKNSHDELPAQLIIDLGAVDGMMEEMIEGDPERRQTAFESGRRILEKWQIS